MRALLCVVRALLTLVACIQSSWKHNTDNIILPAVILHNSLVLTASVYKVENLGLPSHQAGFNPLALIPYQWTNCKYEAWIKGYSSCLPSILNHSFYDQNVLQLLPSIVMIKLCPKKCMSRGNGKFKSTEPMQWNSLFYKR